VAPDDIWKADGTRAFLLAQKVGPAAFRSALMSVHPLDRDAWVDRVFGLAAHVEDGPELPKGCAPYLPCPVDAIIAAVDEAGIKSSDVFVDVGFGIGRVGLLVRLLTGAAIVGIEIQSSLVAMARSLAQELKLERFATVHGDASQLARYVAIGSVFFFYCPFSGLRLNVLVDELEVIAKTRPLRFCGVNTVFPSRPWLDAPHSRRRDLHVCHTWSHRIFQNAGPKRERYT
jgi:hypothetical protein